MTDDSLGSVIAGMSEDGGQLRASLPACWLQGRTAYGGASAALALAAAAHILPDLPPLRSAQISFIAPLGGELELRPSLLRRGRSAAFVRVDIRSDGVLGMVATLLFATARESQIRHLPESIAPPARGASIPLPADIAFVHNFDHAKAGQMSRGVPSIRRWARLKRREGLAPSVELLAVADVLPPPALFLLDRPAPISTMTWQINLLSDRPTTADGWWLLGAEAELAHAGFSSQAMQVWNSDGLPVATALQSVALFG